MHPHTPLEDIQIQDEHYAIYSRLFVGEYAQADQYFVGAQETSGGSGLLGYSPLLSATLTWDLESPVASGEFRLHLGTGNKNLSPHMSTGMWIDGGVGPRPLFDPGRYLTLETKCVSRSVRIVTPPAPRYQAKGTFVSTDTAFALNVPWPGGHQKDDYALLLVETANQAPTLVAMAGFTLVTSIGTGTAGGAAATKLFVYECRATTSAMTAPRLSITGDHMSAQILTFRGVTPVGIGLGAAVVNNSADVAAAATTAMAQPGVTPSEDRCCIVFMVAGATDTTTPQVTWGTSSMGNTVEATDSWTNKGNGGGFSVLTGKRDQKGQMPAQTGTLATASVQARITLALRPPLPASTVTQASEIPWRPCFTGVIDSANPASDDKDVLVVKCRDVYADVLDAWIEPSRLMAWEMPEENIDTLLQDLMDLSPATAGSPPGIQFSMIGVPNMLVPAYFQDPGSVLLAMRTAGLQNGWDLRGRWGTPPYSADQYVLTYYEPDRAGAEGSTAIFPNRYYALHGLDKSRDEVRNVVWVKPSDPPRDVVEKISQGSIDKYRRKFMMVSEDVISLIRTPEQADALATAILSDTSEPKVMAEIEMRFMPFIEINDTLEIWPNGVHHDAIFRMAISGFTHTFAENGDVTSVIRTRNAPAAANEEWRRGEIGVTKPQTIISIDQPTGAAPKGSIYFVVD